MSVPQARRESRDLRQPDHSSQGQGPPVYLGSPFHHSHDPLPASTLAFLDTDETCSSPGRVGESPGPGSSEGPAEVPARRSDSTCKLWTASIRERASPNSFASLLLCARDRLALAVGGSARTSSIDLLLRHAGCFRERSYQTA